MYLQFFCFKTENPQVNNLKDEYLSQADITCSVGKKLKRDGTDAIAEFCCLNA